MYIGKCNELAMAQQQIQEGNSNSYDLQEHGIPPVPTDKPRQSTEIMDNDTDGSSISSIPDTATTMTTMTNTSGGGVEVGGNRKKMGSFMAQMRTQLAAATAGANDLSKQNARFAKIKKDIHDTDHDYRQGVRYLEHLRKAQIETMNHAMKNVEVVFLDKAEATRSVLTNILNMEHAALLREASLTQGNKVRVESIDPQLDVSMFRTEYQNKHFTKPEQIYYENYYNGAYKDVLFGSSLDEYAMDHQRTVPLVVSKCINAVEQMGGLKKEGIYRISGRQTNVDMLKTEFEKNEETFQPQAHYDVFTIANVLKIYLRELAAPLVPYSVSDRLTYSTVQNLQQRLSFLQHKVSELSQSRRDTLEAVVRHLEKVHAHSDINKMNIQNLSYMFTPAIFHDHNQAEQPGEWRSDLVFEDLVFHHDVVFAPIARKQLQLQNQQQQSAQQQQQQQQRQSQNMASPPTPLARGQSSDFNDPHSPSDPASGPAVPVKSTSTNATKSRSRSSTLTQVTQPPMPPLSSKSSAAQSNLPPPLPSSSSPSATTPLSATPQSDLAVALPPMAKMHSFTLPSVSDLVSATETTGTISSKTHSTPSTPTIEHTSGDSPSSSPVPATTPSSATGSSAETTPRTQGLLRKATLKAKSAIPPRQQSLRSKQGRPPGTTAQTASASTPASAPANETPSPLPSSPSTAGISHVEGKTGSITSSDLASSSPDKSSASLSD
ncbi:unnamed protein product [Absidia cylindrospora]